MLWLRDQILRNTWKLIAWLILAAPLCAQYANGYNHMATFTVNASKVTGTQSSFTVVVAGTATAFRTVGNSGYVVNTCTQTLYGLTIPADFIFTSDAGGTSVLTWQWDTYTASTGAYSAHVLMPSVATSTILYAWYNKASVTTCQGGSASGAFDANFKSVLATPNGSTLNVSDYIGNTTTKNGSVGAGSGLNSGMATFPGSPSTTISIAGLGRQTAPLTDCIFFKTTATPASRIWPFADGDVTGSFFGTGMEMKSDGKMYAEVYNGTTYYEAPASGGTVINDGSVHQACMTVTTSSPAIQLLIDGAVSGATVSWTGTISNSGTTAMYLGNFGLLTGSNFSWLGSIAEYRHSNVARGTTWINAEFNNVSSPGTFWTVAYDQVPVTSGAYGSVTAQ